MVREGSNVYDKVSKREGKIVSFISKDLCLIETPKKERFTQKAKLLSLVTKTKVD